MLHCIGLRGNFERKKDMIKSKTYFSAAATYLLKKGMAFKYTGDYIECASFTLTQHVDGNSMWVEDNMGHWSGFTNIIEFKQYLSNRFPAKVQNRK